MAPVVEQQLAELAKRYCEYRDRNGDCRNSTWYWWGRWVLAGIVVLVFLLVMGLVARRNGRQRRARGQAPLYGTGFLAGPAPPYTPYPQGGNSTAPGGPPPPQYVYPDNTGNKFNPGQDGYYGQQQQQQGNDYHNNNNNYASSPYGNQQQSGIELQQPQGTYQRGTGVDEYAPPEGPPPPKRN